MEKLEEESLPSKRSLLATLFRLFVAQSLKPSPRVQDYGFYVLKRARPRVKISLVCLLLNNLHCIFFLNGLGPNLGLSQN